MSQQPVSNSVVWNGFEDVVDGVQLLNRRRALPVRACQRNRIVRREPADGSAQVDVWSQHRAPLALEFYGDHAVTDRLGYCSAQRAKQDLLNRPSEPAPSVIELGCLLAV